MPACCTRCSTAAPRTDALADLVAEYWSGRSRPSGSRSWPCSRTTSPHRARALTAGGAIDVFGGLHPEVRWSGEALLVDRPYDAEVDLGGRG